MRAGDCSRWANVDAALARSAAIANRLIRRQVKRRQNFGEKEPGPELRIEQHGAFSVPADTCLRCMVAFQNRTSIDVPFLLSAETVEKLIDLLNLACDDIVVVI